MTSPRHLCGIPSKLVGACDLAWGHDGRLHANRGDGFYAREHDAEHGRRQLVLDAVVANPDAFAEIAAVLSIGSVKHGGGLGPNDAQTASDHAAAIRRHVERLAYTEHRDHDTGRLTLGHIAARAVLAIQRARRAADAGEGGQR